MACSTRRRATLFPLGSAAGGPSIALRALCGAAGQRINLQGLLAHLGGVAVLVKDRFVESGQLHARHHVLRIVRDCFLIEVASLLVLATSDRERPKISVAARPRGIDLEGGSKRMFRAGGVAS